MERYIKLKISEEWMKLNSNSLKIGPFYSRFFDVPRTRNLIVDSALCRYRRRPRIERDAYA